MGECVAAGGDDGMGTMFGYRVMTSPGVKGSVYCDHAYPLILRYLAPQVRQHWCINYVIAGNFPLEDC